MTKQIAAIHGIITLLKSGKTWVLGREGEFDTLSLGNIKLVLESFSWVRVYLHGREITMNSAPIDMIELAQTARSYADGITNSEMDEMLSDIDRLLEEF